MSKLGAETHLFDPFKGKGRGTSAVDYWACEYNNSNGLGAFGAGARSFFYHLTSNKNNSDGAFSTIKQTFEWTESIDPNYRSVNVNVRDGIPRILKQLLR